MSIQEYAEQIGRNTRYDTGEYDQRKALVGNTKLGDQLPDPDAKKRTRHHAHYRGNGRKIKAGIIIKDRLSTQHRVKNVNLSDCGEGSHRDGEEHGPFFHELLPFPGVLFQTPVKGRDDRGKKLYDDLGGNIRINTHRQDRKVGYRAAGKQVEHIE